MCGIIGVMSRGMPVDPEALAVFRDRLAHRGPDGKGLWLSPDRSVALGHRRLALVDLSPAGAQPMENEDGTVALTMNGEIYNHRELRAELQVLGHRFRSTSDSEVALHGYEQWGPGVVDRLEGMFAFGIWDENKKSLLLARDRFGIKPLYYHAGDSLLLFASELKALDRYPGVPRELDFSSVCDFFTYRYVPSPKTIWKGIAKLPPAHFLLAAPGRPPVLREYWKLAPGRKKVSRAEAVRQVGELLSRS
ncbi:MAG: asparagine synthetase B, partial [Thermodesulfobacteriota bacterium]